MNRHAIGAKITFEEGFDTYWRFISGFFISISFAERIIAGDRLVDGGSALGTPSIPCTPYFGTNFYSLDICCCIFTKTFFKDVNHHLHQNCLSRTSIQITTMVSSTGNEGSNVRLVSGSRLERWQHQRRLMGLLCTGRRREIRVDDFLSLDFVYEI